MDDARKTTSKLAAILKIDLKAAAEKGADSLVKMADKADGALKAVAKAGTVAIGAVTAGVAAVAKQAIEAYADYEQLVGGVETLFKDSSAAVLEYADNAYTAVGLSANAYMETVTSFSASLLQSLSGEAETAVGKANLAITDMADNANKMGTDISMIQTAYQGFAKQNYTMLDNLKIGYGGTKEEMERLIADANALNAAQGKLTDYSIDSFADIVDAIHDVQSEMGITGTTAKEAASTIQGSMSAAKAAWKNLMTGIADGNQDFDKLVNNFVGSVGTAADNILPRVSTSLDGILKLVNVASEKIIPQAISVVTEQAPSLIEAGANIVLALGDAVIDNADAIFNAVVDVAEKVVPKLAKSFQELVPKIAKAAGNIVKDLDGVAEEVGGIYLAFKSLTKGNWIGAGIGLAVTAIGALRQKSAEAEERLLGIDDATKNIASSAETALNHINNLASAADDAAPAIEREYSQTSNLVKELDKYVDANGKLISMAYQDRVDTILGPLSEATGVEMERNGDLISQYGELKQAALDAAQAKRASSYIEAHEDEYNAAIESQAALVDAAANAHSHLTDATNDLATAQAALAEAETIYSVDELGSFQLAVEEAQYAVDHWSQEYSNAEQNISENLGRIKQYEEAYAAFETGNYNQAIALLSDELAWRMIYAEQRGEISRSELEQFEAELEEKISKAEWFKDTYGEAMEGYTDSEIAEMEATLARLRQLYAQGQNDARAAGAAQALALADGFQSSSNALFQAVGNAISGAFSGNIGGGYISGSSGGSDFSIGVNKPPTRTVRAQAAQPAAASPYQITINVHAQTDDLAKTIAREVQNVLDKALNATGINYKAGRTRYA